VTGKKQTTKKKNFKFFVVQGGKVQVGSTQVQSQGRIRLPENQHRGFPFLLFFSRPFWSNLFSGKT
jgi:hypothetical protein